MEEHDFNIAAVSDLHLSQGWDPLTGRIHPLEDFFFDTSFARFLMWLDEESLLNRRKWRLVIAGDMVDFLQIISLPEDDVFTLRPRERDYGLGTSTAKTIWKMGVMARGHKVLFRALGRFLASGHRLAVISGNHDVEWSIPAVQEAFREVMSGFIPTGDLDRNRIVRDGITFCPWFYYEPGLVWIEHGHQYDGINSFDWFLHPWLPDSDELMLPAGSFFVRYLFNKVEQADPFADNIKPMSVYLRKYALRLFSSGQIRQGLRSFLNILGKVKGFKEEKRKALEEQQCQKMFREAERFGIARTDLEAVRRLWMPCHLYNKGFAANMRSFFTTEDVNRYQHTAAALHKIVKTPYIIFGHTHEADLQPLSEVAGGEYVNCGSWTKIFNENLTERLIKSEQEFVFVRILKNGGAKMELMAWRDDLRQGERVKLFA